MLHFYHLRKRRLNSEKHTVFDILAYFIGITAPLMTIPQLYTVWVTKNVSGVSILTWAGLCFFNAFWVIYGLKHKDRPIIISNVCWILAQLLIVLGIVINR